MPSGRLPDKWLLGRGGAALAELASIDLTGLDSRCADVELIVACDVDNPLQITVRFAKYSAHKKAQAQNGEEPLDKALYELC